MPLTIPTMIAEMHQLRDTLEKEVVGAAAVELQGIFGAAEVELAKQEKLFQALLTDADGKIQNIPANLEAAGAYYRDTVKPQIDSVLVGPGKAWSEKTVPLMHKAGRRLASVNLDVGDLSPELVKSAFDNISIAEKGVLTVGFKQGYQVMNTVGDDVGTWFRQTMLDSVVEGIPVDHYDPNVDSLKSRLIQGGRIKPLTIKSMSGKTIHRSIRQRAQAIARIESTRIINRTHEALAEETLGDEAVFRNSNPQDSRSTRICESASTQKAMSLEQWDNSKYGRPPRLSPFHLCRSVLIAGRPEWFDDVPEAQLQGAGLAKTTLTGVPLKPSKAAVSRATTKAAQEALQQAAIAAAKDLAADTAAKAALEALRKKLKLGQKIDSTLSMVSEIDPLKFHKASDLKLPGGEKASLAPAIWEAKQALKPLEKLLDEDLLLYKAVAAADEFGVKEKLVTDGINGAKFKIVSQDIELKIPAAAKKQVEEWGQGVHAEIEFDPKLKPLLDEAQALSPDLNIKATWGQQYEQRISAAIGEKQTPLILKFQEAADYTKVQDGIKSLEDVHSEAKAAWSEMLHSNLFNDLQMKPYEDQVLGYSWQIQAIGKKTDFDALILKIEGSDPNNPDVQGFIRKAVKAGDEGVHLDSMAFGLDKVGVSEAVKDAIDVGKASSNVGKIEEYTALLNSISEGKLTAAALKKTKKKAKDLALGPGGIHETVFDKASWGPSDVAKAIKAAEDEAAALVSPEAMAFHLEYEKLVTSKKITPVDSAEILQKYKDGKLVGKASAKAKQASETVKDQLGPPSPAIVQAPAPPPSPTAHLDEWKKVDQAWEGIDPADHFTFKEVANIGGAHSKEFWLDPSGDKWMFKPFPHATKKEATYRGMVDEFAYKLQRLVDPVAAEARFVELSDGRRGSIQRWIEGSDGNLRNKPITGLTPSQLETIQKEHVLDWLISNHDGHPGQLITFPDGRIVGIDKGQAFKFLGDDKLDFDYHPNSAFGESEPIYNTAMKALRDGDIELDFYDPVVTLKAIEQFEAIPETKYRDMLEGYAQNRFRTRAQRVEFIDLAVARKNALRADFEGYYRRALKDETFTFGQKAAPAVDVEGVLPQAFREVAEEAEEHGWQGKAIDLDGEDIEDLRAVYYADHMTDSAGVGHDRANLDLKVRHSGGEKVMEWINKQNIEGGLPTPVGGERVGTPMAQDTFFPKIEAAVKTLNMHVKSGDFDFNESTLNAMNVERPSLNLLATHADPEVAKMAKAYMKVMDDVNEGVLSKTALKTFPEGVTDPAPHLSGKMYGPYLRQNPPPGSVPAAAAPSPTAGFTVRRETIHFTKRTPGGDGGLTVNNDRARGSSMHNNFYDTDTVQYEITFDDGTRIRYRPYDGNNDGWRAQQGIIEGTVNGDMGAGTMDQILEKIKIMGLDTKVATPDDFELMYLKKQAYCTKEHITPSYISMIEDLNTRGASQSERIAAMRKHWSKKKKIKDKMKAAGVTELQDLPDYNPTGEFQSSFFGKRSTPGPDYTKSAGYRSFYRFDLDDADTDRFTLQHSLYTGGDMAASISKYLQNNGVMASTNEKMRIGIPVSGMSPGGDMQKGGAVYFYTRLRHKTGMRKGQLYFKGKNLRRMDAAIYKGDAWGDTRNDFQTKNRKPTPSNWDTIARKRDDDETDFKTSMSLIDDIDVILTKTSTERREVIKAYKDAGWDVLPDGRAIEEVVK